MAAQGFNQSFQNAAKSSQRLQKQLQAALKMYNLNKYDRVAMRFANVKGCLQLQLFTKLQCLSREVLPLPYNQKCCHTHHYRWQGEASKCQPIPSTGIQLLVCRQLSSLGLQVRLGTTYVITARCDLTN